MDKRKDSLLGSSGGGGVVVGVGVGVGESRSSDGNLSHNILLFSNNPTDGLPGLAKEAFPSPRLQGIGNVALSLANATVGAGIIGLPFAFRQAGLLVGILLATLVAFLTNTSLNLMVQCGRICGKLQYADLAEYSLGIGLGSVPVNLAVIGNGIGSMLSYLIILGDCLEVSVSALLSALHYEDSWLVFLGSRQFLISLVSLFVLLPMLLWCRNIARHPVISSIGVVVLPLIVIIVFLRSFILIPTPTSTPISQDDSKMVRLVGEHIFSAVGIMAFAFVSNHAAFNCYGALKQPSWQRWLQTTSLGVGISLTASVSFAIIGYLAFGDSVRGNLLLNFPRDDPLINFGRICLAINMVATFPTQFVPVRLALSHLYFYIFKNKGKKEETPLLFPANPNLTDDVNDNENENEIMIVNHSNGLAVHKKYIGDLALFLPILGISLFVTDLGVVLSLVGGMCATLVAYVMPAAIYLAALERWRKQSIQENGFFGYFFKGGITFINVASSSNDDNDDDDDDGEDYNEIDDNPYNVTTEFEPSSKLSQPISPILDTMALLLFIFGVFAMFTSTLMTILQLVAVKKWRSNLKQEERSLERQIRGIENEEAKIKRSIKQAAKRPDSAIVCRTLAKELIASRKAKDRIHTSKAQLNSVSMQLQQQAATIKVAGSMAKSTQIMKMMGSLMKVSVIRESMMSMSKEMMKAGIIEEMMEDALDIVADDDEDLEQMADEEVDKVVEEIMMGAMDKVGAVPRKKVETQANIDQQEIDEDEEAVQNRLNALKS